jgi:hypothetical protein
MFLRSTWGALLPTLDGRSFSNQDMELSSQRAFSAKCWPKVDTSFNSCSGRFGAEKCQKNA